MEVMIDGERWHSGAQIVMYDARHPRIIVTVKAPHQDEFHVNPYQISMFDVRSMFQDYIKPGVMPQQVQDFDMGGKPHLSPLLLPVFVVEVKDMSVVKELITVKDDSQFKHPTLGYPITTIIHPVIPQFKIGISKVAWKQEQAPDWTYKVHPGYWPPTVGYQHLSVGDPLWYSPEMDPIHPRLNPPGSDLAEVGIPAKFPRQGNLGTVDGMIQYLLSKNFQQDQARYFYLAGFCGEEDAQRIRFKEGPSPEKLAEKKERDRAEGF